MPLSHSPRLILQIAVTGAVVGAIYSSFAHHDAVTGAVIGGVNGAAIPWLEIVVLRGPAGAFLRRLPFLASIGLRSALYFVVVVLINAVCVPLLNGLSTIGNIEARDIVFALAASFIGNLLLGVDDLLGPNVLVAFVAGRYYRPRIEERALLFVDLRGSTATAERLGGPRFLDFLNAVFTDLSAAIVENGGEIHKYIGDEIIATWRLGAGLNDAGAVRAWASARKRLAASADAYRRRFGLVPEFRAALHAGEVVVGELGSLKKEIALIGDAMNTAARILDACRAPGARFFRASPAAGRPPGLDRVQSHRAAVVAREIRAAGALRARTQGCAGFGLRFRPADRGKPDQKLTEGSRRRTRPPLSRPAGRRAFWKGPMHIARRAAVVASIIFAGAVFGNLLQWLLPTHHLADAKSAISMVQALITLLLAVVLGLLVWTSYGVYSQQQSEAMTLGTQILQLDLVLDRLGSENAARGRERLRDELKSARKRFWGEGEGDAPPLTYPQARAELCRMGAFFDSLKPVTDEERTAIESARTLSTAIVETHLLMGRQLRNPVPTPLINSVILWAMLLFCCVGLGAPLNTLAFIVELLGAVSVASAFFLILEFSQPYVGLFRIPSDGINQIIAGLGKIPPH
jgi:adenylate cyclase